jgi:hypothetical protein
VRIVYNGLGVSKSVTLLAKLFFIINISVHTSSAHLD